MSDKIFFVTVKAFSCESSPRRHKIMVSDGVTIRVWDDIGSIYTTVHSISEHDEERILWAANKRMWQTFVTRAYTYDVANDQRSAGGVHLHQVRKGKSSWQKRIEQSNGRYSSYSPVVAISDADGEAYFATAMQ